MFCKHCNLDKSKDDFYPSRQFKCIACLKSDVVNKRLTTLTNDRLREVLNYEPQSGLFTWNIETSGRSVIGLVAGSANKLGYVVIGIDGVKHYAHRLAFLYMNGEFPNDVVDHIDGNKSNNSWINLRGCSQSTNAKNLHCSHKDNSSGLLGVHKHRNKFDAVIYSNGEKIRIGRFATPEQASAAYQEAKLMFH